MCFRFDVPKYNLTEKTGWFLCDDSSMIQSFSLVSFFHGDMTTQSFNSITKGYTVGDNKFVFLYLGIIQLLSVLSVSFLAALKIILNMGV